MEKDSAKLRISQIIKSYFRAVPIENSDYQGELASSDVNNIVDKIELGHPKVKLPQAVGEEINEWMFNNKDRLVGHIGELIFDIMTHEPKLTNVFDFVGDGEENYFKIIDAYRYGWEAEPEAKWYVKAPESWKAYGGGLNWLYKSSCGGIGVFSHVGDSNEKFTRAELKQYHLDSDIFTLVPVGEEK